MSQTNTASKIVHLREPNPPVQLSSSKHDNVSKAIRALAVLQRLLSTLDLEILLKDFVLAISSDVPIDGFDYALPERDLKIRHGRQSHQSCSYTLTFDNESLGSLVFKRRRRFEESELQCLEELLCVLVHPLRNALKYHQALRVAHLDPLTNLPNRQALERQINREMGLAERYGTPLSFMVIDIDNFKSINDKYGHLVGDEILKLIAKTLTETVRNTELVFRYGGDEFVILLSNTDIEGAHMVAERLRAQLDKCDFPVPHKAKIRPTASVGVTQMKAGENSTSLFQRTDEAMYDAKARGRNRVCIG